MTLQELHEAAAAGRVEGLDVVSLEGGFTSSRCARPTA